MFLKRTKRAFNGKTKEYANIVESYRKNNKIMHKTLLKLGPINTTKDLKRFNEILDEMKSGNEFVKINEINVQNAREFGVTYTVSKLFEKYGIDSILSRHLSMNKARFNSYEIIKALIVNRLIKPSSDLSASDWIEKHYSESPKIESQHIYRALDYLIPHKESIESDIFSSLKQKLKLDTGMTHYDLTSSYVEGKQCEIAMFGYSRDHRKDRKQIVLGLAMCDGIPIMHQIHKGDTTDKTTLDGMKEYLKSNFKITNSVIVADGGLMTEDNVQMLEDGNFGYLLGVPRRNNNIAKTLLVKNITSEENQSAKQIRQDTIERGDKEFTRRYILCLDKNTRKERLDKLGRIRKKIEKKLTELQKRYDESQKTKGKKMKRDSLMVKADKILGKNKRLFNAEFRKGLVFSLKADAWKYEKDIAGKFLLVTNADKRPEDAMKAYKELQMVENAFDEIKNFLDVRPIYHYKEGRVRAHVFVCILAFLVECLIGRFCSRTARKVINELGTVKSVEITNDKFSKKLVTRLSPDSERIFEELGINKSYLWHG